MLSNAYFLAKFRFDTAENEPAKNLQKFAKFANFADRRAARPGPGGVAAADHGAARAASAGALERNGGGILPSSKELQIQEWARCQKGRKERWAPDGRRSSTPAGMIQSQTARLRWY